MAFINQLETAFQTHKNIQNSLAMAKYMKNHFAFYGIKTTDRRLLLKEIWHTHKEEIKNNIQNTATELYTRKQRELHYCAIEIVIKESKGNYKKSDIRFIEKLITTNSWWDSVDTISKYILGQYLLEFPDAVENTIEKFSNSDNLWLNRSAILFQLGYKEKTDFDLLKAICQQHENSTEFFIQKAIGWSLREYAKTNPDQVILFVENSKLKPLSKKEAVKNL
ncbi:DNA alkylation repair protein [Flavobacterium sp. ST-87]|uniref:DNA alkylation repair protein n=1 Tax=Flavobacterium plantiphilum TaxID=3163297 RepID=A0ABW8XWE5_9FLAO